MNNNEAIAALAQAQVLIESVQTFLGATPEPIPPDPNPNPDPTPPGVILLPWSQYQWFSAQHGGWQCTDTKVFAIDVPAGPAINFSFAVAEYGGAPTIRQVMLSRAMGSFDPADAIRQSNGTTATIFWNTDGLAGQRLYFNCRNWSVDLNGYSCQIGSDVPSLVYWNPSVG